MNKGKDFGFSNGLENPENMENKESYKKRITNHNKEEELLRRL
jgi:hypothetical protein